MILTTLVGLVLVLAAALGLTVTKLRWERRGAQRRAAVASRRPYPAEPPDDLVPAPGSLAPPDRIIAAPAAGATPAGATPAGATPAGATPAPAPSALERHGALRSVLGLLAHEMRTPLGAIIGYGELLGDGLLGELPERAADAVRRMETAGGQLRHLIDGLADLMLEDDDAALEIEEVAGATAADALLASARVLAAGRGVQLDIVAPGDLPVLHTDPLRLAAALDLAVGAAIRASPGASLRLALSGDDAGLTVTVGGTALEPARDLPPDGDESAISTGAGLRLGMAARMLRLLRGSLTIEGSAPATLIVRVPSRSIDAPPPQA